MEDLKSDIIDILEDCILNGNQELDFEGMCNTADKIVSMIMLNYNISFPE